jgi:hypothetical protein
LAFGGKTTLNSSALFQDTAQYKHVLERGFLSAGGGAFLGVNKFYLRSGWHQESPILSMNFRFFKKTRKAL